MQRFKEFLCEQADPELDEAVSIDEQEIPKVDNKTLNLRDKEFKHGKCENCIYFVKETECKILVGPVAAELVCDGFQGTENAVPKYKVEDWLKFVDGLVATQPYEHKVIGGHLTPEGPIIIIEDSLKPKPHRFSLSKDFHIAHTTREHYWSQEDIDKITK